MAAAEQEVLRTPRDNRDVLASVALPVCIDIDCLISLWSVLQFCFLLFALYAAAQHGKVQTISHSIQLTEVHLLRGHAVLYRSQINAMNNVFGLVPSPASLRRPHRQ